MTIVIEEKGNVVTVWGRYYCLRQRIFYRARGKVYVVQESWDGSTGPVHSILQLAEECPGGITLKGIQVMREMHLQVVVFIGKEPKDKQEDRLSFAYVVEPGDTEIARIRDPERQGEIWSTEERLLKILHTRFPQGYLLVESMDELLSLCRARL